MGAQAQIHGKKLVRLQHREENRNLVVLRGSGSTRMFNVHPLVEAFNKEHGTNLKVVAHDVADTALNVGETWRDISGFAFVVDASIAYEKPGTKLGKEIVFSAEGEPKVVLATGKYKGERDVALVALGVTEADFKKDGNSVTLDIPESRLVVVPDFPGPDGWYIPHAETGVPHGEQVEASAEARYLYRLNDSSYVGLLARGVGGGQGVDAFYGPSNEFGVVTEVPEGDAEKVSALISAGEEKKDKKTTIKVVGVSADELRSILARFRRDLESLGSAVKGELLEAGRKLENMLSGADLKE